ncbi:hypothetical protein B0H11DRAFT_1923562 [Mycena galericulata]|nr:hypothetical protein B0H11DRAFT_1923562 [Mycena galericulata]
MASGYWLAFGLKKFKESLGLNVDHEDLPGRSVGVGSWDMSQNGNHGTARAPSAIPFSGNRVTRSALDPESDPRLLKHSQNAVAVRRVVTCSVLEPLVVLISLTSTARQHRKKVTISEQEVSRATTRPPKSFLSPSPNWDSPPSVSILNLPCILHSRVLLPLLPTAPAPGASHPSRADSGVVQHSFHMRAAARTLLFPLNESSPTEMNRKPIRYVRVQPTLPRAGASLIDGDFSALICSPPAPLFIHLRDITQTSCSSRWEQNVFTHKTIASQSRMGPRVARASVGVHTAIVFTIGTSTPLTAENVAYLPHRSQQQLNSLLTASIPITFLIILSRIPARNFNCPTPPSSSAPARTNGLPRLADSKGLGSLLGSTSSYILLAAFQHPHITSDFSDVCIWTPQTLFEAAS